jgi:hypothetical protein
VARPHEEAAASREVDADPRHEPDDEHLEGEQHLVRKEPRLPVLHRRQPSGACERDQRLASDAQDEEREQRPEEEGQDTRIKDDNRGRTTFFWERRIGKNVVCP